MKFVPILCVLVYAVVAMPPKLTPEKDYHTTVGIPLAERIRQQEMAVDFDGSRIIGGSPTVAGVHPFVVGLLMDLGGVTSICTASMLSNTRTLSAAHCGGSHVRSYTLVFGSTFLFSGGARVTTNQFVIHPMYGTFNYDIAVIRHNWVGYTNVIQPIAIPTGFDTFAHQWAMAVGYGQTNSNAPIPSNQTLHQVWLWVMSNDECRAWAGNFLIPAMICTSGAGGVGICNGDSGGPLYITIGGTPVQIGVTSFKGDPCEAGGPSGYIRTSYFQQWIRQQ